MNTNGGVETPKQTKKAPWGLIAAAVVAVAFIVFVVQNGDEAEVTWLFFDTTGPLWVVILVAAIVGAFLSEVAARLVRRSRRR